MGKRLIISEQEKNDIRSRYGLINEQKLQLDSQEVFELQTALNDYFKMKKVMENREKLLNQDMIILIFQKQ